MLKSTLPRNEHYTGLYTVTQNIGYCETGQDPNQTLDLIVPWEVQLSDDVYRTFPLIVFVQGSGWQVGDNGFELIQLAELAKQGYIIAMIRHRNAFEGNPFPAYLTDVKTAIRFLRAHAEKYAIDTSHVIGLGTSSGGNAIQLVGLTANDARYKTTDYEDYSDGVDLVISCFGVSDVVAIQHQEAFIEVTQKLANPKFPKTLEQMSPVYQVYPGKNYPPFLLLHGSHDTLVPYQQMPEMAAQLENNGYEVETVTVTGADHESDFWSTAVWQKIEDFIETHS